LQRHLPEDRGRRRIRRRCAVGEVRRDLGARARCTGPVLAAVGRGEPLDLGPDRASDARDQLLDRLGEVRRKGDRVS